MQRVDARGVARNQSEFIFPGGRCDAGAVLDEFPELSGVAVEGVVGRWSSWPTGLDGAAKAWDESQRLYALWLPRGYSDEMSEAVSRSLADPQEELEQFGELVHPLPQWARSLGWLVNFLGFIVPIGSLLHLEAYAFFGVDGSTPIREIASSLVSHPLQTVSHYLSLYVPMFYTDTLPSAVKLFFTIGQDEHGVPIFGPLEFVRSAFSMIAGIAVLTWLTGVTYTFLKAVIFRWPGFQERFTTRRSMLETAHSKLALMSEGAIVGGAK